MTDLQKAQTKLIVAVLIDVADFFIGRIPGFGTLFDLAATALAVAMFGWKGFAYAWEVLDVTDQVDGFVPTLTLLALAEWREAKAAAER
jgi:hypothetical protein